MFVEKEYTTGCDRTCHFFTSTCSSKSCCHRPEGQVSLWSSRLMVAACITFGIEVCSITTLELEVWIREDFLLPLHYSGKSLFVKHQAPCSQKEAKQATTKYAVTERILGDLGSRPFRCGCELAALGPAAICPYPCQNMVCMFQPFLCLSFLCRRGLVLFHLQSGVPLHVPLNHY